MKHKDWPGRVYYAQWADHIIALATDSTLDSDDQRLEVKWALQRMVEEAEAGNYSPPITHEDS